MTRVTRGLTICLVLAGACRAAPGKAVGDQDISARDMRARITFLASDMLRGRDTPSRGLDLAAQYIGSEFRRFGLESLESDGRFVQRYELARTELEEGWSLALESGGRRVWLRDDTDFWAVPSAAGTVGGPARFMGSEPPARTAPLGGGVWVARLGPEGSARDWLRSATRAGASALLLVAPRAELSRFRDRVGDGKVIFELGDVEPGLPAAVLSDSALDRALRRLGLPASPVNLTSAQLEGLQVRLSAHQRVETLQAPNVIGLLRGRDPALRDQYVIMSAHMDGLGVGPPVNGDSIYNGADDNASGTAALLEVAEVLANSRAGTARSVLFLAVSGEEKGLLGSSWFVNHPPVPLDRIVADVNVDMIGRNWQDRIAVIGKPYSSLGALVDSVAGAHPELRLKTVGDLWPQEGFFFRSDHFNFARKGIPAIFFFNGVHEDYHQPSDEADRIEYEKAARIARLICDVVVAVADAPQPPRWDERARAAIVEGSQ